MSSEDVHAGTKFPMRICGKHHPVTEKEVGNFLSVTGHSKKKSPYLAL